ncbi:MAG TPA: hypothetical protein VMX37_06755 [Acidimicrobiia bacterium]|nr:hypothetical protein [Acidimicrobiia bacterium]
MNPDDPTLVPDEPTQSVPVPPTPPALPDPAPAEDSATTAEGAPAPEPASTPPAGGPRLGHVVLGAILVLIGVGWLLEALDVVDVPWRYLLPSALIIVGVALAVGARTGSHGGLVAVGVVLTVLVLLAGALDVLADIPFSGGIGEKSHQPTGVVQDEYRWGMGKMTLDLREADALAGEEIEASVVIGELLVIVPDDVPLVITGHAGVGDVILFGEESGGFDADLQCVGTAPDITCGDGESALTIGGYYLRLDLEVAVGKVEVQR